MQDLSMHSEKIEATLCAETRITFQTGFVFASLLYSGFWAIDYFFYSSHKWTFLLFRLIHLLFVGALALFFKTERNLKAYRIAGLLWATLASGLITAMIFVGGDSANSPYYAGLDLVAITAVFFIPYTPTTMYIGLIAIFLPYYLFWGIVDHFENLARVLTNSSFMLGTVLIALVIRKIGYYTRCSEVAAQAALANEIADREIVIHEKTQENIKLFKLSNQFSPQVVQAIRSGKIQISPFTRRDYIATINIDIVNSTERVVHVEKEKVHQVITMFLEDTVRTLLKYDVTIDKFLGDGILAFSNNPIQRDNFVERTVRAALEIMARIQSRQGEYKNYWMDRFKIRIGIALGHADVGFYGNDKYYKCYTAIGPVMNLACRLCASAEANQILVTQDIVEQLPSGVFASRLVGERILKGFDDDTITCFSIDGYLNEDKGGVSMESLECPSCRHGILYLDTNTAKHFVFKCRHCGFVQNEVAAKSRRAA